MKIKLKEIWEQLNIEDIATKKTHFIYTNHIFAIYGIVSEYNKNANGGFICYRHDLGYYDEHYPCHFSGEEVVDWIGNNPKKLYAALVSCETPYENSAKESDSFIINWINKEAYNKKEKWFPPVIKWLPEDEYPPQEI